jgi:DNA-directed RNA polymerase specialized sigma24 family protein
MFDPLTALRPYIRQVLFNAGARGEDLSDLEQETLLRVWRGARKGDLLHPHRFAALCARHVWASHLRDRSAIKRTAGEAAPSQWAERVPDPAAETAHWQSVQAALFAPYLRAVSRACPEFYLRVVCDLEPAEIATLLHIPAGTVRSRVFRQAERLRAQVSQ